MESPKKKILVLGTGLIGSTISKDLAKNNEFDVSAADISQPNLERLHPFGVKTIVKDLSKPENVEELVKDFDIIVNSLPGGFGYRSLTKIAEMGKNCVDIAFYENDPYEYYSLNIK